MADMRTSDFLLSAADGAQLFVRSFLPEDKPRGVIHIAHGMAEHSARYERFARRLTDAGIAVYANDHRGHGKTARGDQDLGFFADENGWDTVVADLRTVLGEVHSRHRGLPLVLMGHSMGSYIARCAAMAPGVDLSGLIISGSTHEIPRFFRVARLIARFERMRRGPRKVSPLINQLSFGSFNKRFDNPRTDFDWLSRDPDEVDKYVDDPHCGFDCTTQMWIDVFTGMEQMCSADEIARLSASLPVHIVSGELDPVHNGLRGIRLLRKALGKAGLQNVSCRIYPGARHELLNETNRDEVETDLLTWLQERLS